MTIEAPAKVNLVLRLRGKRPDGFHEIETLMVPLTLADKLDVTISDGDGVVLTCDDLSLPTDATNLAHRAAVAFAGATGQVFRTTIHLQKKIPSGAGLAGGSSDAAAVLLALNELLETHLATEELEIIAGTLGSDVPFFVRREAAWCRGRGEIIEPAPPPPRWNLLLVKPPFPVPTAWAYQAWAASTQVSANAVWHDGIELANDLELPVFSKYLLLPVLKDWLAAQPEVSACMMSGSGSTLFAIVDSGAQMLASRVREEFGETMWTHACSTDARHPQEALKP